MKNKIFLGVKRVKGVKTIAFLFLTLLMILPLSSCYNKENREEILKVYNWGDYIDEDILAEFPKWYEEQTGKKIRVIYQTFDINEVMLTKIERGHEDYDVVCPSEYIIERMLRKDLLLPIDTAFGKTPNYLKNVSPYIVEQIDATSNHGRIAHNYAVPYMWGTCGILYNKVHVPQQDAQTWGTLWNRKYRGKLLMKDSYRDSYGTALIWEHREDLAAGNRSGTDERLFAKGYCHRRKTAEGAEAEHRGMGGRLRQGDDDQGKGLPEHDLERRCRMGYRGSRKCGC